MIKHRVSYGVITSREITRETKKKVFWIDRRGYAESQELKDTSWHSWHDKWADAHARLLAEAIAARDRRQLALDDDNSEIQKIRAMKPPATTLTGDKT